MKLLFSLLGSALGYSAGCGSDGMVCETQCPFTNVGRKWKTKQQFMFYGEDHIVTRLSPSYNGLTGEKDKDFRFTMRFDRNKCTKKLLDAMYAGDIGVEVMDKSLVYNVESMDWDTSVCKNWQQALYVQVRHTNNESTDDWMQKERDLIYMSFHGLRNLDALGIARAEVEECMEQTWIDRMDAVGNENSDFTKCMAYARCDETPDWSNEPAAPDYNDVSKTLSCDANDQCTLTFADGQSFIGFLNPDNKEVVQFRGIYFAEAPTGQNRWKAPIPITFYDSPVDATSDSPGCVNEFSEDGEPESEDCLHVNIAVKRSAIENNEKLPTQAYIHGGGLNAQSNNLRDFTALAANGVLSVSINYRLGAYGFFPLAEIEEGQLAKANWGFQDQLAGLKWINMFAGAFGGDKDSVVLDGCSAGSFSGFYHMTNPASWPYFHRAIMTGIGTKSSGNYVGARTDKITETVLATAGVSTVDELRAMSVSDLTNNVWTTATNQYMGWVLSWSSGVGQPTDGSLPVPGTVRSYSPEGPYLPIIDGITYTDLVMYKFRRGEIRPNTPMAWSISKDDSWLFRTNSYEFIRDYLVPSMSQTIKDAQASTGFEMPPPYVDMIYELLYPDYAQQMIPLIGCIDGPDADCREGFAKMTQMYSWMCPTKWAFSGAIKDNAANYGDIYPMHFEVNNCEWVNNQVGHSKTCHCAEQNWVQGSRTGAFGEEVGNVYLQFYKEGTMPSDKMKTWAEMNYDAFNIISDDERNWSQEAIGNWDICNIMDQIQDSHTMYSEGHTLENPTGGWDF